MPRAFKFLSCAALTALMVNLAFNAGAQAIESDSSAAAIQVGGNGTFEANLVTANDSRRGLSDFAIELNFRTPNLDGNRFDLEIKGENKTAVSTTAVSPGNPILHVSYEAQTGWRVATGTQGATTTWQPISGLATVAGGGWYRFRLTGRNWGESNAYYNLQLSDPHNLQLAGSHDLQLAGAHNLQLSSPSDPQPTGAGENGLDDQAFTSAATNLAWFAGSSSPGPLAQQLTVGNGMSGDKKLEITGVKITPIFAYHGPVVSGVNTRTLYGKVMCGYQGWFSAPGDGSPEHGWRHWTKDEGPLTDGNAKIDLWPDVSELNPSDRFPTGFKMPDGSQATVFSSYDRPTVLKHFEWMQDYGIDGVFVQRFANGLDNPVSLAHCDTVLASCREGANLHGRAYAVMYDLSGLPAGHIDDVINDWRALRSKMVITEDPAYLNHHGKPVVAIWGIGFNDHRAYTLAECRRLIEFLKNDPEAGGCTVMLGVPANWRELRGDAVDDPELLKVIALADIVSPWTVGRYIDPSGAARYAEDELKPDQAWCHERNIDYMPVVFPGFSWHNMKGGPSNQIPRLHGQFLWSQFRGAKNANVSMLYVAMFDEVDEGTAIFKCVNNVPVGEKSKFVTFEGLPSDFYLRMVGDGTKLIHGETLLGSKLNSRMHLE